MYYARVVFEKNASAAERHDDVSSARRWIEEERYTKPDLFRLGQIFEATPDRKIVAICDLKGWRSS
jgi:hypothetical protein